MDGRNPNPRRYLRQVDLPGVHTKLIEENSRLLSVLCAAACPSAVVDPDAATFERRFGFRPKPRLVRFRALDPSLLLSTTDSDGVENEVSFLSFPSLPKAICVWGAGSGLEHLALAPWLTRRRVTYWGDLDTHGFAILQQLRAVLPDARSMLMDRSTLEACRDRWGSEDVQVTRDLPLLDPAEREAYDLLRDQRLGRNLRLEQELIPQHLLDRELRLRASSADG